MLRKRMLAFLIDYIIFILLFMMCNIIPIYDDYFLKDYSLGSTAYKVYMVLLVVVMIMFICKDIKGRSIGKRIAKIKVKNTRGEKPSAIQLIIRNITLIIWPVEFLILLLDKQKIGDILAKTVVVDE